MSRTLPLFPLNLVAFPGEKLNLHIFEPRYKKLIEDCLKTDSRFGLPSFLNNQVTEYGTEIRILAVEKTYTNGELDIKTQGSGVFKILNFQRQLPGKPYAGAEVEDLTDTDDEDPVLKAQLIQALQVLYEAMGISSLYQLPAGNFKAYDVAHHIGLSISQEYHLLQIRSESERQQFILEHLQRITPVVTETERLKMRIKQNGHFKQLLPPSF